ncbi:MAG: hypothetical protein ACO3C1_13310 [Ilumatobacteraceae bacterium]
MNGRDVRRRLPWVIGGIVAVEVAVFAVLGPAWTISLGVLAALLLTAALSEER